MNQYRIVPKRDFGGRPFLINGKQVAAGFVVTDGFCNIMPGATWFQTISDAMDGLNALILSKGDSDKFWQLLRIRRIA